MPYKNYEEAKKNALKYYYENKEKVLKYQKERLKRMYVENADFKIKRQLRDKSRKSKSKLLGECKKCGSTNDLHRHHPSYDSTYFVVLCRKCHNELHNSLKNWEKAQSNIAVNSVMC